MENRCLPADPNPKGRWRSLDGGTQVHSGEGEPGGGYRLPPGPPRPDLELRDALQRIALEFPRYGWPQMTAELQRRGWPARSTQQGGRCTAAFPMSFLRQGEIYPFDKGAITQDRALAHRKDESPAGYSLAGCTPAQPASASPADAHLAGKRLRCTMHFQRTARSVLAIRLNPGDNPTSSLSNHFLS